MRGVLPHLKSLATEFAGRAQFTMAYITEAHAQDVWPISSSRFAHDGDAVLVSTPQTTAERCQLASNFARDYGLESWLPVVVDPIENPFEQSYAPWPIRFYVLSQGQDGVVKVALKLQPQGASYDLAEVRRFLMETTSL